MATWRFFQGLRTEWRWYRFNDAGSVIAESDQGFAELQACMKNAETAGFTGDAYQVHTREGGNGTSTRGAKGGNAKREIAQELKGPSASGAEA